MKDTKENRIKFLKENKALNRFKRNIREQSKCLEGNNIDYVNLALTDPSRSFIGSYFDWSKSTEGREYWNALHFKYISLNVD